MKNFAGRRGCYPPRPSASVDNILRDLQNSSYATKAEFNNCFIIHSKYFKLLSKENLMEQREFFEYICASFSLASA